MMPESRTIRRMSPADLEEVVAVEELCHTHPWSAELFRRELENPVAAVDLLLCGGRLAGFLCSWLVCGELQIHDVATAPPFRRRGVAAALLRHVFERSRSLGLDRAFLEVRVGNAGAIALYESFAFRTVSRRPRYYPDGEDALIMEWIGAGDR